LLRGVNRHRLQPRFLGQRVHDGAREALGGIGLAFVFGGWWHGHVTGILAQAKTRRDGKDGRRPSAVAGKIKQVCTKIRLAISTGFWHVASIAGIKFRRTTMGCPKFETDSTNYI
jgi:hypothetical protein